MIISERYICDICKKVFNNKTNLTKHKNKKYCIIIDFLHFTLFNL